MLQLGLPISSMLGGLFSRGVDSAPHSRVRAGNRDAQSNDPKRSKQIKIIANKNSPRIVDSWTTPVVSDKPWSVIVGGGGVTSLPFCLGTAYNVCSMEYIGNSWLLC